MGVEGVGSGNSAAAAAAAAEARRRAEEARRRAEEARKRAEAARKAAEQARKQAAEARKQAAEARKAAAAKKAAEQKAKPEEKPKATKAAEDAKTKAEAAEKKAIAAEKKAQAAEEQVALAAKKAEDEMKKANAAAKAEKKPEPFSAKEIEKNQLTSNEVKNAFDGASTRRKDDLAKALGVDGSAKPEAIAKELSADREYAKLAGDSKNRAALEQLGIKDGKDLVKLGDRLEGQMNRPDGTRRADDVDFSKVKDKDALAKIIQGAGSTRSEEGKKAMGNETFATLVANGVEPSEAKANYKNLEALGYSPKDIADAGRLSNNHTDFNKVLKGVSTLADPKASAADKIAAAIELGDTAKKLIPPAKMEGMLGKALSGLPSAKATVAAIGKLTDPNASGIDKAKAALDLAKEIKGFAGDNFPRISEQLRRLDGPIRAAGAAMTLMDGKFSLKDDALAFAQLAAELPDIKGGLTKLKDTLKGAGVQNVDEVVQQGDDLAELARRGVDPALAGDLTPKQLDQLTQIAGKTDPESLEKVVKGVTDKTALGNLITELDGMDSTRAKNALGALSSVDPKVLTEQLSDPQGYKQIVEVAGKLEGDAAKNFGEALKGLDKAGVQSLLATGKGMSGEALSKVLSDADSAKNLGKTLAKLDPTSAEAFARIAKDMDGDGMKVLLKFAAIAPNDVFNQGVRTLAPILEKGGGKLLGKALGALDAIVSKLGVKLTADVGVKVFKSLVKMAPVVGAVPNAIDAFNYAKEAKDLHGKNKDLGFLAMVGAGLNTADAAFGIIADATGIGVLADIGGSIAFSVAELALDLGFSAEKEKMLKNPDGYEAPDWVKAVNIVGAVVTAPAGIAGLVSYYGPKEAGELALWAVGKGGELAKKAWDALKEIGGPVLEYATKAVETLKNMGEAGVEALKYIATAPGELGKEVASLAIGGLKDLGEEGVEALKGLAEAGGELAEDAVGALKGLAEDGVEVAKDALGGLKDLGGEVADLAGDALDGLGDLAGDAVSAVNPFD